MLALASFCPVGVSAAGSVQKPAAQTDLGQRNLGKPRPLIGDLDETDAPDHAMDGVAAAIDCVFLGRRFGSSGSKTYAPSARNSDPRVHVSARRGDGTCRRYSPMEECRYRASHRDR